MKKIGVISDTHGKLWEEVRQILADCDMILHAGDIDTYKVVEELKKIAPLYVVRGNADTYWAADIPKSLHVQVQGLHFFVIHNKDEIHEDISNADIVIYGHSHIYEEKSRKNQVWLNPGSCGPGRFFLPVTMAVIEVKDDGTFQITKKNIAEAKSTHLESLKTKNNADLNKIIHFIMRDIDKGVQVEKIAKKYGIMEEDVDRVCRMYLTHPGIDVDGVLNRL